MSIIHNCSFLPQKPSVRQCPGVPPPGSLVTLSAPCRVNVFIAECKFWKGHKAFREAIDQLLGYAT